MGKCELLFSITKNDKSLRWDYYRGSGKGGQVLIEEKVEKSLRKIKVEVKEDGKWVEENKKPSE